MTTPPFFFRLPESFDPRQCLRTPKLHFLLDDARYLVSTILTKLSRGGVDCHGTVRLMAKHLRSVMHSRHYRAVVDALLEGGVVVRSPYVVGRQSYGYTLADRFLGDQHVRVPVQCSRLKGRLAAFHGRISAQRRERMLPVHFALERQQLRLGIDIEEARRILSAMPKSSNPYDAQGILVTDIHQRDFRLSVGRYGRVSNSISSMKKELRSTLICEGVHLANVDIANSQPALLARIMLQHFFFQTPRNRGEVGGLRVGEGGEEPRQDGGRYDVPTFPPTGGIGRDFELYCQLVQGGEIYDFLLHKLQIGSCPNLTRKILKKRFLADVIAKRKANSRGGEYPSEVEAAFKAHFPSVYRFIRDVNVNGWEHANLIRRLQRAESQLVIETVAADLLTRHPTLFLISLHDALYTTPSDMSLVLEAFERAFEQMGFALKLEVSD